MIVMRTILFVSVLAFGFLSTPYASAENVIVTDVVVEDGAEVDLGDPGYNGIEEYDPLESMNRLTYRFNANFDKWMFLPAVRGYRFVAPQFLRTAFSNFLANMRELPTMWNSALQGSGKKTVRTFGRFFVNTTLGFGGLLDPATPFGMRAYKEDFGQTLGKWGVGSGAYLVLPILGPSSVRDTGGLILDRGLLFGLQYLVFGSSGSLSSQYPFLYLLQALQFRDDVEFRYGQLGSAFEYEWIRWFYLEFRRLSIEF
jgi:phospholipid-binding lipoprotein MlaA